MKNLRESDRNEVLVTLREEGLENLLLEKWLGDFSIGGGVTLSIMDNKGYMLSIPPIATLFSFPDDYKLTEEEKLFIYENAAPNIMGPHDVVHEIAKMFPDRNISDSVMMGMVLKPHTFKDSEAVILKKREDFTALLDLYMRVPEFRDSFTEYTPDGFADDAMKGMEDGNITTGRFIDGKLVSAATFRSYELENVCTDPKYRRKGYSSSCLRELSSNIPTPKDGKRLILFTGNPDARHLYETIGFESLGRFSKMN